MRALMLAVLLAAAGAAGAAEPLTLESPATRVALLELYTSEGCSSCPPADRWVSGLVDDPRLWTALVPVAFHVDYWDYIGWKDPFADPRFGARQRRLAAEHGIGSVYTPGLVVSGREWRGWFTHPVLELGSPPTVGALTLEVRDAGIVARFRPRGDPPGRLEAHIALLGFGLESDVRAGENEGRRLHHDFVVLAYERAPMARADGAFVARLERPRPRRDVPRLGIAGWVNAEGNLRPIQATGGWLPR